MKRQFLRQNAPFIVAFALLTLTACTSSKVRREVAYPALSALWQDVRVYAADGGATEHQVNGFTAALEAQDTPAVTLGWPVLEGAAYAGIDANAQRSPTYWHEGMIGTARENVKRMSALVDRLERRPR